MTTERARARWQPGWRARAECQAKQRAQEGAEADLGRGEVALQVDQEGHLGGQGGRHDGQVSP